jgi:hypothetical protein
MEPSRGGRKKTAKHRVLHSTMTVGRGKGLFLPSRRLGWIEARLRSLLSPQREDMLNRRERMR